MRHLFATVMLAFSMTAPAQSKTLSGLCPENFCDTIDGKPTALYVLKNEIIRTKVHFFPYQGCIFSAMFVFAILVFYYFCTLTNTQKKTDDEYNNISLTHLRSRA